MSKVKPEDDASKPALKDRFADVFGSLADLEAKHETFVNKNLKGGNDSWKKDPTLDDVVDKSRSRYRKLDGRRFHEQRSRPENQSDYHRRDERSRSDDRSRSRGLDGSHYAGYRRDNRRNKVPDYKVHPDKWVCYDLSDVDNSQLTQRSNTAAAFSFLNDLRKQKEESNPRDVSQGDVTNPPQTGSVVFKKPLRRNFNKAESSVSRDNSVETPGTSSQAGEQSHAKTTTLSGQDKQDNNEQEKTENSGKIMFKKPKRKSETNSEYSDKHSTNSYRDGALVMPEYVIGAKTSKPKSSRHKQKSTAKTETKAEIKLSYYDDEDGDVRSDNDESDATGLNVNNESETYQETEMDTGTDCKKETKGKNKKKIVRRTRTRESDDETE